MERTIFAQYKKYQNGWHIHVSSNNDYLSKTILKKDKDKTKVKKMKCSVSFNVNGLQHVHDNSFVENVYLALMVFLLNFRNKPLLPLVVFPHINDCYFLFRCLTLHNLEGAQTRVRFTNQSNQRIVMFDSDKTLQVLSKYLSTR